MSAECSPTASACFCVCSTDASSASSSVEEVGRPLGSRPGPLPWEASSGREALEEPSGSDSATRGDLSRDLFRDCIFRASSTHGLRWANPNVMWRGIGCAGRVCLPWSWTVSQRSREPVQERGSGAEASGLQCMSRLCRAGCMVPIWGFRCALYASMSIAVHVLKLA